MYWTFDFFSWVLRAYKLFEANRVLWKLDSVMPALPRLWFADSNFVPSLVRMVSVLSQSSLGPVSHSYRVQVFIVFVSVLLWSTLYSTFYWRKLFTVIKKKLLVSIIFGCEISVHGCNRSRANDLWCNALGQFKLCACSIIALILKGTNLTRLRERVVARNLLWWIIAAIHILIILLDYNIYDILYFFAWWINIVLGNNLFFKPIIFDSMSCWVP